MNLSLESTGSKFINKRSFSDYKYIWALEMAVFCIKSGITIKKSEINSEW